jgi:hypothetical protein
MVRSRPVHPGLRRLRLGERLLPLNGAAHVFSMTTTAPTQTDTTLDYIAAFELVKTLMALPKEDRALIGEWSLSITDYAYWYRKTFEAVVVSYRADPVYTNDFIRAERDDAILDCLADGDTELLGAALAELARPLVGKGVHRAALNILEASYLAWTDHLAHSSE